MRKKRNGKGFTLVEIIVVLVVLAVLAAIAIPSMTGWIDAAYQKRLIVACRACVTASQTVVSERYGETGVVAAPATADILALARVTGTASVTEFFTDVPTQIRHLVYSDGTDSVLYCAKADDHPEHYNFISGNIAGFSGSNASGGAKALVDSSLAVKNPANFVDSTSVNGDTTAQVKALLTGNGIDLASMNIRSWSVQKESAKSYVAWITDLDINAYHAGDQVRVVRFNRVTENGDVKETYTAGYMQIATRVNTEADGSVATYNVLTGGTKKGVWTEYTGTEQTAAKKKDPDAIAAIFNTMPDTLS